MRPTMDSLSLIREFLQGRLGVEPDRIVPEALLEPLGVDSLMVLELMFEFEQRFGITLAKGTPTPRTVSEMASLMDRLRSERQSSS
ncbi:acyl carrier protein [Accumulibacter sp.]|uniref:acyl carrier protein n=1 Tax=Accumulibacter sp. TaxID=2053492 RepID=UPI003458912A